MNYKFTFKVVKNINADSLQSAKNIAKSTISNFGNNILGYEISCEYNEIMNSLNAHNKRLVDLINISYNQNPNMFNMIVNTLAMRDADECKEKEVELPICQSDEYDYLMKVADDEDLKVIIGFIRPTDSKGELLLYKD